MNKIYIADLHAYNEGYLKGEWVALPVDQDELQSIIDKHSNDGQFDYAIHDYELPFSISEHESPYKLNKLFVWLEENRIDLDDIYNDLSKYNLEEALGSIKNIAYAIESELNNYEAVESANNFIDYDEAEEMAKQQLESGGLVRLPFFIGECNFASDNVFYINGYGNLEPVRKDTLVDLLDEVVKIAFDNID